MWRKVERITLLYVNKILSLAQHFPALQMHQKS